MYVAQWGSMASNKWTREELIIAFNLYCKIPFGKIHIHNPQIISLAKLLSRTPSAVSWKLANFARLDPSLQNRNVTGASHGSKLDIEIWNEFSKDWEKRHCSMATDFVCHWKRSEPISCFRAIFDWFLPILPWNCFRKGWSGSTEIQCDLAMLPIGKPATVSKIRLNQVIWI